MIAYTSAPFPASDHETWICTIECSYLFVEKKQIVGISREQAAELANLFLMSLWDHAGIKRTGS
ncbi:MAG: hypothetical protein ACPGRZ_02875 [Alphaproteobacteria bacterium]